MEKLKQQQQRFMQALTHPHEKNTITQEFIPTARLSSKQSLKIYQDSAEGGLFNSLAAAYPVSLRLVGPQCFAQLSRLYWSEHPQRSATQHQYGQHLAHSIETTPLRKSVPYLADVARLEWACFRAAQAPKEKILTLDAMASQSLETQINMSLPLCRDVGLIDSAYPIDKIWQANQKNKVPVVTLDAGAARLLVRLVGLDVIMTPLSEVQMQFLQWCDCRKTLGEIAEMLSRYQPNTELGHLLQSTFQQKVFVDADN